MLKYDEAEKRLVELLQNDKNVVLEHRLSAYRFYQKMQSNDAEVLQRIVADEELKTLFFDNINGILILKNNTLNRFVDFLSDEGAFTQYQEVTHFNLRDENKSRFPTILQWQYKDCLLAEGHSKATNRTNLRFLHQEISKDEVQCFLSPKLFCNATKMTAKGKKKVSSISEKDNLILKGNNLIALHSLAVRYSEKVKFIYIDPPYNTGTDSFGYNDKFNHSAWLTFMSDRLKIAHQLLHPDGVIFIHISDEEMHYLKVLTDEIFGRNTFVGTIPRRTRNGKSDVPFRFSQDFDWILCYTKTGDTKRAVFRKKVIRKYYTSSDFPHDEWRLNPITTQRTIYERPNSNYTMVNPKNGEEFPVNPNRSWAVTKYTFPKYYAENKIVFPGDYDFLNISKPMLRVFKSEEIARKGKFFDATSVSSNLLNVSQKTLLEDTKNKKGTDEMIALFGTKSFAYPKNEQLLQALIASTTETGDLVMDFFLGSGTTAAVAHKMQRQYIGIEQVDEIFEIALNRLQKVIAGEQGGVSKLVGWNGGGEVVCVHLYQPYAEIVRSISQATTEMEMSSIYQKITEMKNVDWKRQLIKNADFEALSKMKKKLLLFELISAVNGYVAVADMPKIKENLSTYDKRFNQRFYE